MSTGLSGVRNMELSAERVGRCTCLYEVYLYMCAYVVCGAGNGKWVRWRVVQGAWATRG